MIAQMLLLVLFASCLAVDCDAQWECSSVTTDYNYVRCKDGKKCQCRNDQGFSGDAKLSSKCSCGGSVYWISNQPYCLTLSQVQNCAALTTPPDWTRNCTEQWQCQGFSANYQYMNCSNQECVCLRGQGFVGEARPGNLCRCMKDTLWIGSKAYCLDVKTCAERIP